MKKFLFHSLTLALLLLTQLTLQAELNLPAGMHCSEKELATLKEMFGEDADLVEMKRIREHLANILQNKERRSFVAKIPGHFLPVFPQEDNTPRYSHGIYRQYIAPDNTVFRRLELFDKKKCHTILIGNRDGEFIVRDGHCVKCPFLIPLHYDEQILENLSAKELGISTWTEREVDFGGVPCLEIKMTVPKYRNALLTPEKDLFYSKMGANDFKSPFYKGRPMSRIFLLDKETGFIYSRKEFNLDGKLLFERRFEDVSFKENMTESDFQVDLEVEGEIRFLTEALYKLSALKRGATHRISRHPSRRETLWRKIKRNPSPYIIGMTLTLAGICFGVAAFLKRREKRQSQRF